MALHSLQDFIRRLCRARSVAEDGQLTDAQLLERFAHKRDEAAFEVLVWRHGALVLNVARRLLGSSADIEDVFQATFLTLARKASAIRRGTAVGSWLYKVAYRLAVRVRQDAARSRRRQLTDIEVAPQQHEDGELAAVLAEEVSRLPERYRAAVVLCYLQGATTEQAARVLGCPRGTVLSRLSSARQRLRQRLVRRGIAPVVAATAVTFGEVASATPPAELVASVVGAALAFAAGRAAVPMVSPHAAALARGALQAMLWNKIKITAAMLCVVALAGSGAGWLSRQRAGVQAAPPGAAAPAVQQEVPPPPPREDREVALRTEIKKLQARMDSLAEQEEKQEAKWSQEVIEARLQLIQFEEELKQRQQQWNIEREVLETRLKITTKELISAEELVRQLDEKFGKERPAEQFNRAVKHVESTRKSLEDQQKVLLETNKEYGHHFAEIRKEILKAEESLRRVRFRQDQHREEYKARRQTLLTRMARLEDESLPLAPADRLREVERKLDTLRREVNELRRTLERPKER
jgi:RNA polymerase sigma factor (sigma-70 family)